MNGPHLFARELEKVDVNNAATAMVMFMAGPEKDPNSDKAKEQASAMMACAKIGMIAILMRSELVPLLRGMSEGHDDTTLENDLIIGS